MVREFKTAEITDMNRALAAVVWHLNAILTTTGSPEVIISKAIGNDDFYVNLRKMS